MKILQVHNYYQQSGGEDIVLKKERDLLLNNGHQVKQFTKDNEKIKGILKSVQTAFNTRYSSQSRKEFKDYCDKNVTDLIHVHNFFPLITPSIFDVTSSKKIPTVLTLHNYRLIHPNSLMLHDGKIDERSVKGSAYQCVKDGVYRGSIIQTAVVANMIEYHRNKGTWNNKVDGFIALTEFAKRKFIEGGLPESKIFVKPNFVEDPLLNDYSLSKDSKRNGFLYVGRISEEKGVQNLVKAWINISPEISLTIIGDGPLKNELQEQTKHKNNVNWIGRKPNAEVYKWLNVSKALIFPSICYEGFPLSILEALSLGCPVISSNIGSQKSMINDEVTGLHYQVGDPKDLIDKVNLLEFNDNLTVELGKNARKEYINNHTPERNYKMLMEIYENVLSKK